MDFYFAAIERGEKPTVGRFSLPQVLGEPGPAALMRTENSSNPDIRWIHLPFNSMKYTKVILAEHFVKALSDLEIGSDCSRVQRHRLLRS